MSDQRRSATTPTIGRLHDASTPRVGILGEPHTLTVGAEAGHVAIGTLGWACTCGEQHTQQHVAHNDSLMVR